MKLRSACEIRLCTVQAQVVTGTTAETLTGFVYTTSEEEARVYTEDAQAFQALKKIANAAVKHSVKEYVIEFVGRHNIRELDKTSQMESTAKVKFGKLFTYKMLPRKNRLGAMAV